MKEKHLKIKRIVAIAIALVLVIANLPMAATRATGEEEQVTEEVNIVVTVTGSDGNLVNKVTFEVKDGYTVVEDEDYVPEETTESTEETSSSTESTDDSTESTDDSTESTDDSTESTDDSTESTDDSTESTDDSTESTDDSTESTDDSTESTDDDTSSTGDEGEVIDPPAEGSMEEQTTVARDVVAPYGLDRSGEVTNVVTLESATGVYPLTITKNIGEELEIIIYEDGKKEHCAVLEYDAEEDEYEVELKKYAKVLNSNAVFDVASHTYTIEIPYNTEGRKEYYLEVEESINKHTEGNTCGANVYWLEGVKHVIQYQTPGYVLLKLQPTYGGTYFEETFVMFKVSNGLKFAVTEDLKKDSTAEYISSETDENIVDTVIKQINPDNYKFKLPVTCVDDSNITYSKEVLEGNEDNFSISSSGRVTANDLGIVKVNAVCGKTGEIASYIVKFVPTEVDLNVKYVTYESNDDNYAAKGAGSDIITDEISVPIYSLFDLELVDSEKYNYNIAITSGNSVISKINISDSDSLEEAKYIYKVIDMLDSSEYVTMTITATKKDATKFYDVKPFVLKIKTVASGVKGHVYITQDGKDITLDDDGRTIIPYRDNDGDSHIELGTNKILLDIGAAVYSSWSNSQVHDYNVIVSEKDGRLEFEKDPETKKIYVINADKIVRNENYTVNITLQSTRFENNIDVSFIFRLESYYTRNEGNKYYSVSGIHMGVDGKSWWKTPVKDGEVDPGVIITAKDGILFTTVDPENGPFESTYEITGYSNGDYNKQYIIYAGNIVEVEVEEETTEGETVEGETVATRVETTVPSPVLTRFYLGLDLNAPVITGVNVNEGDVPDSKVIYTNKDVTLTFTAEDSEKFLYDATLYVDGVQFGESFIFDNEYRNITSGTHSFTINRPSESKTYKNVTIEVRDISGNKAIYTVGDIVFDLDAPTATFTPIVPSGVKSYTDAGNTYYSGDINVEINIVDKATESVAASGFAEYEIYVNGNYYTTTSANNYTINTLNKYGVDGKVVIEVRNIKDHAGNKNTSGDKYVLYVDKKEPEISYDKASQEGNITAQGNFYNKEVTYTFSVGKDLSGIKSVTSTVGSVKYDAKNGKVTVTMKANDNGNVSLTLTDNVDNTVTYALNNIKNSPFKSNYIIVDTQGVQITFPEDISKDTWYKDAVTLTVDISDVAKSDISSGIASAVIKVNGKVYAQYSANRFVGDKKTKDTFTVVIDTNWINDVINDAGSYTVSVEVYDNAGVQSTNDITVHIDMVDPEIKEFTGVANGSVNTGVVTLNVLVEEKHYDVAGNNVTVTVKKTLDGVTTDYPVRKFEPNAITTSQVYTFNQDGTYEVVVSAIDAAGNPAVDKTITFTVDNTAPSPDISGVTENYYYTDGRDVTLSIEESNFENMNVTISIEKELNGTKTVIDSADMNKTGKISTLTQSFTEEGTYTIKVDAVDAAGNSAVTRTVIFTIDNANPVINITGVENGAAYKDAVIPSITITDNYFASDYTVTLTKNGVKFDGSKLGVNSSKSVNVTDTYIGKFSSIENGVNSVSDTFEMIQDNDGIYTLTVVATDKSGRTSQEVVNFSVNRFGSVYTFDENLVSLMGSVNTEITEDIKITEFNPNRLLADSIEIAITRDGALVDSITVSKTEATTENVIGESGWYQYDYVISKDNFANDGLYVITVSSKDEAGNNSENITYDQLSIRFAVDTTKPEVVKITGLSKTTYDANSITVSYEVYDAVGIREVRVFLNGNVIQTITEFGDDNTAYAGSFVIEEGIDQHISFQVVDIAGNVVDSDNPDDVNSGKIVNFKDTVTVSTNVLIRWYANKTAFYGSIIAAVVVIVGIVAFVVFRKKKTR